MGSLPGIEQLRGLVKETASFSTHIHAQPSHSLPTSLFSGLCPWVRCTSLSCRCLQVVAVVHAYVFLCFYSFLSKDHDTKRSWTSQVSSPWGIWVSRLWTHWAFSRMGLGMSEKVKYSCNLNLLQYQHLYTSVLYCCQILWNYGGVGFGSALHENNNEWTNEQEDVIPSKDAEGYCEEQIQTAFTRFYANS